ncbi:cilia- and flagella-associated protein 337-like [Antedon mediterranea]|uniref:cilia- and flagella-associated protein 337-like n=1 Tax=Antedon mediterranea TaxID=105859 RepID=UPI003AF4C103
MPHVKKSGRIIRPTSANAKLQSYYTVPNNFDEVRPATAAGGLVYNGDRPGHKLQSTKSRQGLTSACWTTRQEDDFGKIDTQVRRLSISGADGIADRQEENAYTTKRTRIQTAQILTGSKIKIEERISLEHLHKLKQSFLEVNKNGTLSLEQFQAVIKNSLGLRGKLNEDQVTALFMKIDSSSEGFIAWDKFCTYMQLEYEEKEDSYLREKEVVFQLPATSHPMPHRENVLRVCNMSDGTFVVVSQDGAISFWNGAMELKRTRSVMVDQNTSRQKPKWITDFILMPQYNKFILGTGDREIQFYELSTFEPYCQISGLETTPLKLAYCATGYDECLIIFGDSEGCINIIIIKGAGETLRTWKKMPKTDGIASVTLEKVAHSPLTKFLRWKVHNDWVAEVRYYDEIRMIISCSNNENTALVIGNTVGSTHVESQLREIREMTKSPDTAERKAKIAQQNYAQARRHLDNDQLVFRIHKGVKTFDFSKKKNVIVTGGMDRIVRIWNPYVPVKPTGMLRGHNAPITGLFIATDEDRIFSISQDKTVKVWDIKDQACMLTVRPKSHKIRGDIQACHYNSVVKCLAVATSTDQMAFLGLKIKVQMHADIAITHKEPVLCAKYNSSFQHIVTCSEGSVVKLWDFETGNAVFEFSQAHDDQAITCMTFDVSGRRLITGGRDGRLKVWNYNNGHCLKRLERFEGFEEVSDVVYVEMNKNRFVLSVGWDRRINMYSDSMDDFRHVQNPLPKWTDDVKNGHREDILSVAACAPSLLATSSYDGEVIVWNLVSGHIYCHLFSPPDSEYDHQQLDGDNSIRKLVFLCSRVSDKFSAQLVASGPRGCIHFWNVYNGGILHSKFQVNKKQCPLSFLVVSSDNKKLLSGDAQGFVNTYNIEGYCDGVKESDPPETLASWRAHVESITCMDLVEGSDVVITSSNDCTVRLWTTGGHYIGTLGQTETWDIYNPSTYIHPMVPYDVLVDPLSMPSHPVLNTKSSTEDVIRADSEDGDSLNGTSSTDEAEVTSMSFNSRFTFHYDDTMIANELKTKPFDNSCGKRLRHERLKVNPKDRGGQNAYQQLKCFNLDDTPPITHPIKNKDKMQDPLGFPF